MIVGVDIFLQGSHRSLKTWKVLEFENLDSRPGNSWNFCRGPWKSGIWRHRSIFLIISVQEFSRYSSSEIWVYLCVKSSWIYWKGPWIWHWKVLKSPRIWDVKMCMNPVLYLFACWIYMVYGYLFAVTQVLCGVTCIILWQMCCKSTTVWNWTLTITLMVYLLLLVNFNKNTNR